MFNWIHRNKVIQNGCWRDSLSAFERSIYAHCTHHGLKPDGEGHWPSSDIMRALTMIANAYNNDTVVTSLIEGNEQYATDDEIWLNVMNDDSHYDYNPNIIITVLSDPDYKNHPCPLKLMCRLIDNGMSKNEIIALRDNDNPIIRTAFNNDSTDILDLRDAFNANNVNMSRFDWMLDSCLKWTHAHTNMVLFYLNHMDEIEAYQLQSHDADVFIDCIRLIGFIQNDDDDDDVVPVIDNMIPLMNSIPAFKSVMRMVPVLSHIAAITSRELYIDHYEMTSLFHYIMDYYPNEISAFIDDMIMMPLEYVGQSWLMAINDWKHDNDWQGI